MQKPVGDLVFVGGATPASFIPRDIRETNPLKTARWDSGSSSTK